MGKADAFVIEYLLLHSFLIDNKYQRIMIQSLVQNFIVPLLLSTLIYFYLPTPETNLLVIFKSSDGDLQQHSFKKIGNIKNAFKIIRNVDSHMEHVDVSEKKHYNYAVITENMSEKEIENFKENLKEIKFIIKSEVFVYKTNPVRVILLNLIIKLKGILFSNDVTPAETMLDGIDVLCTDENFKDSSEKYMINVTKEKPDGKADLDIYVQGAVLGLFPKVGSEIFDMGKALSGGWSNVAVMKYSSYAGLCRMANSEEYLAVLPHKLLGLADTHTYLTQRLL